MTRKKLLTILMINKKSTFAKVFAEINLKYGARSHLLKFQSSFSRAVCFSKVSGPFQSSFR